MLNADDLNHLYQYACSLTKNDEQAYDFVHDAVIKLQKYNPENELSYAKTMIRNQFYDEYKKQKRYSDAEVDEIESIGDLESLTISKVLVSEILEKIKPDERELLYEWAVEGKTVQEIAKSQGSKLGTLLSKISRLRKKIIKMEQESELD